MLHMHLQGRIRALQLQRWWLRWTGLRSPSIGGWCRCRAIERRLSRTCTKKLLILKWARELLVAFRRSTGHKPERIIFYRDGVSEGQLADVLAKEMDAIRRACVSLQEDYLPRVTFVVVQKRPRTRLFPVDRNMAIITIVVGSSRPTHYHVLYDENNFTADLLQLLTNSLCYKYARCTCSVSVG